MAFMRKQYEAAFKAKVALEAVRGEKTIAQIASAYNVHPNQIRQWRRRLLDVLPEVFSNRRPKQEKDREELEAELFRQIASSRSKWNGLKKISGAPVERKRQEIEPMNPTIAIGR